MSNATDPPPEKPSLLWPAFAILAWAMLLYQAFVRLPEQRDILANLKVPLPPVSQWALDNALWAIPTLGLVTTLLTAWIRTSNGRWIVLGLVPVLTMLVFLLIQWLALLQIMAGDHPRGL